MTDKFLAVNLYLSHTAKPAIKHLSGSVSYGTRGTKDTKDAANPDLYTRVEIKGHLQVEWTNPLNGALETFNMSKVDVKSWIADTKKHGKKLSQANPGELYSDAKSIDGYSVRLIYNQGLADLEAAGEPLPKEQNKLWRVRFLVNEPYGILPEGNSFKSTDDDWN